MIMIITRKTDCFTPEVIESRQTERQEPGCSVIKSSGVSRTFSSLSLSTFLVLLSGSSGKNTFNALSSDQLQLEGYSKYKLDWQYNWQNNWHLLKIISVILKVLSSVTTSSAALPVPIYNGFTVTSYDKWSTLPFLQLPGGLLHLSSENSHSSLSFRTEQ